jgi:hypothetical protein
MGNNRKGSKNSGPIFKAYVPSRNTPSKAPAPTPPLNHIKTPPNCKVSPPGAAVAIRSIAR